MSVCLVNQTTTVIIGSFRYYLRLCQLKCQPSEQADDIILSLGSLAVNVILKLLYLGKVEVLVFKIAKVVDHLLNNGVKLYVDELLVKFNENFPVGSIVCGSGITMLYDMTGVRNEDFFSFCHADDRLNALE